MNPKDIMSFDWSNLTIVTVIVALVLVPPLWVAWLVIRKTTSRRRAQSPLPDRANPSSPHAGTLHLFDKAIDKRKAEARRAGPTDNDREIATAILHMANDFEAALQALKNQRFKHAHDNLVDLEQASADCRAALAKHLEGHKLKTTKPPPEAA